VVDLRSIMTGDVFLTTSDASVVDAARGMAEGRCGSALVMTGSWLTGIITERDVLRAAASGHDLNSVPVKDWMTRDPVTVGPETDSEEAAGIMLASGFRHLPITEGSNVVGIVSLRDVLSARVRRRSPG
jgi:CBS domain-containing protein